MVISNRSCWVHVSHWKDVQYASQSDAGMPVACDLGVELKMSEKAGIGHVILLTCGAIM